MCVCVCVCVCSYFADLMDLFTPEQEEDSPLSPSSSSGGDLSAIAENAKDDVFSEGGMQVSKSLLVVMSVESS